MYINLERSDKERRVNINDNYPTWKAGVGFSSVSVRDGRG
jgi:hypothetical protein